MDAERPAPAQLAKGALRRLALSKREPTPANFARAYAEEAGDTVPAEGLLPPRARVMVDRLVARASDDAALRTELAGALMEARYDDLQRALDRSAAAAAGQGVAWAQLIDRLSKGLERGARHWTGARKKDSLQRVLDGSRSDAQRLQHRLKQLVSAWESDQPDADVDAVESPDVAQTVPAESPAVPSLADAQPRLVDALHTTVCAGLPPGEPRAAELADELAALAAQVAQRGATPALADAVADVCHRVRRLFGLRHELVDELLALCHSLTDGLADLAEDRSWVEGQAEGLLLRLQGAAGARAVRAARELLDETRTAQRSLQAERAQARDALKDMVRQVLAELGELGSATGRFSDKVAGYAQAIEAADSLDSLAAAVREMLDESRTVHDVVAGARDRLAAEHARASALESRVLGLEAESRRLADEVSTDALTQVANRRGLAQAFTQETARVLRDGPEKAPLAIGLIDIDNFKKLNDSLGHAAGDVALQSLAARVKEWLRPVDHIARFGGEEFVLLLPAPPVDEAQQALTRLQRRLSASLFMHEGQEVFVTFSAGVTAWRAGETVEAALARADEGLYEAKRTGKNRTCVA
ncbi:MAG: GGDEF domain-containing protein [Burkholderiaceae bacterium]|nr:MAG: GGDEF domain-containing protein [Burkholderiaceae bacterium]